MRRFLVLSLLLFPVTAYAQGIQTLVRSGRSVVRLPAGMTRVLQGKMVPVVAHTHTATALQTDHLRTLIERKVHEKNFSRLPYVNRVVSSAGAHTGFLLYQRTLQDFEALRKELNPLLFYQSSPREQRTLASAEKRYWVEQINVVRNDLTHVYEYVEATEPALLTIQEYVDEALHLLVPEFTKLPAQKPQLRQDREFNEAEFFLHDPELNFWEKLSHFSLPAIPLRSKQVAIINDEADIRYALVHAHAKKDFLPGSYLGIYANEKDLMRAMETGHIKPDLILTDLCLSSSSGYLVTEKLRDKGYTGPVIGFSAFREHEDVGREMFSYGLDGLISVPKEFYKALFWYKSVHRKIANYFYYQQLHQWEH